MTAPLLTAAQVATLLGLSVRAVYDLAASGELPSYRFGSAVRFAPEDVETYKTKCRSFGTKRESVSAINCTGLSTGAVFVDHLSRLDRPRDPAARAAGVRRRCEVVIPQAGRPGEKRAVGRFRAGARASRRPVEWRL